MAQGRFRGDRLADARRRSDLSQADLATAIGAAGRERVSQWSAGSSNHTPGSCVRWPRFLASTHWSSLGVTVDERTLRDIRLAAGLSLTDAHQSAGLPYSTYYRLESGVGAAPPSQRVVSSIAKVLGMSPGVVRSGIERSRQQRRAHQLSARSTAAR